MATSKISQLPALYADQCRIEDITASDISCAVIHLSATSEEAEMTPQTSQMSLADAITIAGGLGGGVIDGTVLTQTNDIDVPTAKTNIYTVQNDCLLVGFVKKSNSQNLVECYIGDNRIFWNGSSSDYGEKSFRLPIKKGTAISGKSTVNVTIQFIEYKLNSLSKSVPQSDCASYVVESGRFDSETGLPVTDSQNNDSWYRLYSDGFCEHGGVVRTAQDGDKTITLSRPYANVDYTVLATASNTSKEVNIWYDITDGSSFNLYSYADCPVSWETKGFIQ